MKKLKVKSKKSKFGFTLIEAVVSTSVFAFVIVSILAVYLSALQLDKKTRSQRTVAQSARFMMEYLAKEIRNGSIDYASYTGGVAPTACILATDCTELFVRNQANDAERFYRSGDDLTLIKNSTTATNLNPASVRVTNLKFYVVPSGTPFTPAKIFNEQPRVTIVLELTSNYGSKPTDIAKLNLQSTFAVRAYPDR